MVGEANYRLMLKEVAAAVGAYEQRASLTLIWATLTGAGCSIEPLPDRREPTLQVRCRGATGRFRALLYLVLYVVVQ